MYIGDGVLEFYGPRSIPGCAVSHSAINSRYQMPLDLLLICSILLALFVPVPASAVSPDDAVRQGNALYEAGSFGAAARQYDAAAQVLPDAAAVHFNLGNALFKQRRFDDAVEHYARALTTAAPGPAGLEGRLKYNLGNVAYQRALQALPDAQQALPHLQAAMTYYRDSLEVDPQQRDARYNLELAHTLLRQLRRQPQFSEVPQAPPSRPSDPQTPDAPAEQQNAAQSGGEPPQPRSGNDTAGADRPRPDPQEARVLKPEEAARLLRGIRERAREADRRRQEWRRAGGPGEPVDRDW